jgi:hypothetical protein
VSTARQPASATDPAGTPPLKQSEETTETWSGYFELGGEGHFTKADLYYKDPANKPNSCERALIERYNGTSWQLQEAANPVGKPAPKELHWALDAVSCPTSGSCVTVGYCAESATARKLLLGEEWNGTSWELASRRSHSSAV